MACDAENLTIGVENGKTTIKPEQCVRAFETILAMEQYSNGMVYALSLIHILVSLISVRRIWG